MLLLPQHPDLRDELVDTADLFECEEELPSELIFQFFEAQPKFSGLVFRGLGYPGKLAVVLAGVQKCSEHDDQKIPRV